MTHFLKCLFLKYLGKIIILNYRVVKMVLPHYGQWILKTSLNYHYFVWQTRNTMNNGQQHK